MQQDAAQVLALEVLGWLATQDELFPSFLNASGADLAEVQRRAGDPEFLGAVLEFLMMDDAWVIAFCDQQGHPYTAPQAARAALPGGAVTNWT
jgi:hypothetical protein